MQDEFGFLLARSLAADHVLAVLGDLTPAQALEAGTSPREVWLALCEDLDVPVERRLGAPARPGGTTQRRRRPSS